jgi:hypothetical protein
VTTAAKGHHDGDVADGGELCPLPVLEGPHDAGRAGW